MFRDKGVSRILWLTSIYFSFSVQILAQDSARDESRGLKISGSADMYYRLDNAAPSYTSFTRESRSFSLGMASVKLEYRDRKTVVVADLGFGPRAREFSYHENGITQAIKQLYVYYYPLEWLGITMGTWTTHVGYESLDPASNKNYSTSYLFTYGPFSHTGLKVDFKINNHNLMLGISNPADYRFAQGIRGKSFIAQYHVGINDNLDATLNFVSGKNSDTTLASQWDMVCKMKLSTRVSIALNNSIGDEKLYGKISETKYWWGSAFYLSWIIKSWAGIALRGEYFNDRDRCKIFAQQAEGVDLCSFTFSLPLKVQQITVIPEFRWEQATQKIFVPKGGQPHNSAATVLMAVVYAF